MSSLSAFVKAYGHTLAEHDQDASPGRKFALPVVVSRDYGSGGFLIAERIAKALGYQLFDKNILLQIAEKAKVPPDLVRMLDEKPGRSLEIFGASLLRQTSLSPGDYPALLKGTIRALLKLGSVVVVGRGAAFLAEPNHAVRLKYVAPAKLRAERIAEREQITLESARERIKAVEHEREKFLHRVYGHSGAEDDVFDIVLNTGTLTLDEAFDISMETYRLIAGHARPS